MHNATMIQFFHWYSPDDGTWWDTFRESCAELAQLGIQWAWLPPATKGDKGKASVGYDAYDLFDLGEFDQKGSIRTKYGTRAQYEAAIREAHRWGIGILADAVLNHKAGAERTEKVWAVKVNPSNRNEIIGEPVEIQAFTSFSFSQRDKKYSEFTWDSTCFTGTDVDASSREKGIFLIQNSFGIGWEEVVGTELGNYDYLMFADVEFRNPAVRNELKQWAQWLIATTAIDGFRLDAVKHINPDFLNEWIDDVRKESGKSLFSVAEFWSGDLRLLSQYIKKTRKRFHLFDVPLHYRFHDASRRKSKYDLRQLWDRTLVSKYHGLAVTFVENHDTQPFQSLYSPVDAWFKPSAYAIVLLRKQGIPCVFYADLFGARYVERNKKGQQEEIVLPVIHELFPMLLCRKYLAYGKQRDYLEAPHHSGWTREGLTSMPHAGLAVLFSNGKSVKKEMEVGKKYAGHLFVDVLGRIHKEVKINEQGKGIFYCKSRSVSVWVNKEALPLLLHPSCTYQSASNTQ